jgi:microcystin-dependent protein
MEAVNTTTGVVKRRNAANSAWILEKTIAETRVVARSSDTILGVADIGKTIVATSTFTQTFTATATLGDGWYVDYRNDGTGVITLDPNASELIDGATTRTLGSGESARIVCNGTAFKTIQGGSRLVGEVAAYAGATAPSGWLLCFGQAISRTTYAALFALVGTTYGAGDGSTTFNVPDLRGRVVAGQDDMGGTSANRLTGASGGVDGDVLGGTGGAEQHTLTMPELPSTAAKHSTSFGFEGGGSIFDAFLINTGGGQPHNNLQPTLILNYIIFTGV